MSGAGKHDDGINLAGIVRPAVAMHDFHLTPFAKVRARFGGKLAIALDRDDPASWPHDLGEYGRVITSASTNLHDPLAALPVEVVETTRPQAGLPVVEPARLIDR